MPSFAILTAPRSRRFARDHAARIDFHRWVQFELDRQLGEAATDARDGRNAHRPVSGSGDRQLARRRRHMGVPRVCSCAA